MNHSINRRHFLTVAAMGGLSAELAAQTAEVDVKAGKASGQGSSGLGIHSRYSEPFLTQADDFVDVSRGNPKPFTLRGELLAKARLTTDTWRLEIIGDASSRLAHPHRLEDGTAFDLASLKKLGETHGVKYLKAMQCNNIPSPLGQGLWEGVPLRELIQCVGEVSNVRRVYYWGFHNNDPAQLFQSSLSFNRVMETPPWEPPPLVAYRLNGQDIPPKRGGPVRMIVPWAHGFKSIKWLQRIVLTNDYQANDTYALQNNDPESYLKTAAYLGKGLLSFKAGQPIIITGTAMVGWSGLKRVEYWLRPATNTAGNLTEDDPAWKTAVWRACDLMKPLDDWSAVLPDGTSSREIWGFDDRTGRPKDWPILFSMIPWTARLNGLTPGSYEIRARTVDLNGFAQPEPRPYQKSGMNRVPFQNLTVTV
jgi:DMSO/TMAO reductase YedYZ molybdopterin-dependent catalytic subunit